MKIYNFYIQLIGVAVILSACNNKIKNNGEYSLVWSDEFSTNGLPDTGKWGYDVADGCPDNCGWGNNELQYYTDKETKNARVENGMLIVEAHKEKKGSKNYTSVRLTSKNKGDWKYGKIIARAKLPKGRGVWPAIWMLPTKWEYGGWPSSGEIDIMENVGYMPDSVFGSLHTKSYNHIMQTQVTKGLYDNTLSNGFHIYELDWSENEMSFVYDNKTFLTFKNKKSGFEAWPFDKEFHLLLDIAVGGNWGGHDGVDENIWPQKMVVDYVRVYQKKIK
jgi:beta-glucanase (GH16 family)